MRRCVSIVVLLAALIGAGSAAAAPPPGLQVAGNRLVDSQGTVLTLRGVNRSGSEYGCVQGLGVFDGPSDAASVAAIAAWHVNFVRVLINEDCWLGINGIDSLLSGPAYQSAVTDYVNLLESHGMYVEVSLIWAAPGDQLATYQPAAPDEDHAPAMWASVASAFSGDPDVILAPWGEPQVNPRCFVAGGCSATFGAHHIRYAVAGMQQAVDVIRAAGFHGVIAIPGTNVANDLSTWLSHEPADPLEQLIAEAHVYGNNTCASVRCLNRTMAPVARRVPLIFGEVGETYDGSDCGHRKIARLLEWATAHKVPFASWSWDAWHNCDALIRNYKGKPTSGYGEWVRSYYAKVARQGNGT